MHCPNDVIVIGASVSEPHLGSSTRPLSVSLSVYIYIYIYIYISYVRHFWSRGPRATRKRKPAHLKFKGHMHACCIVANASRAITTLIERLHMYSSSLITSSAGWKLRLHLKKRSVYSSSLQHRLEAETTHEREERLQH